jgi:hypothetical protein
MNIELEGSTLVLDSLQRLALRDAAGATAQVKSGELWITLENDRRDILLASGDSWTIDRDGLTLVQAEVPSTIVLRDAPKRLSWLNRVAAAIGHWIESRSRLVPTPYY